MAAEGAAQSGSRVAGMVGGLWALVLVSSVLALEEVLLDTTGETSEIGWLTYPPGGWDEVSVLDDQRRLTRTFEACHVAGAPAGPGQDNWLQTHFVERRGAQRAHIRLHFSVRACSSLGVAGGTCRETFTLYYRQAEEPDSADGISAWHLKRWTKVDTIAADESFPASSAWAVGPRGAGQRAGLQLNVKERSFGPLTQRGFYVAFQDTGACLALVAVKLFFYACPSVLRAFAAFPETQASGAGGASLVAAMGTCVAHAEPEEDGGGGQAGGSPPRLHCNGEGKWMVAVGGCRCQPGHQPARGDKACQACPQGSYKAWAGDAPCSPCPARSHAPDPAAAVCPCLEGFYRASSDPPEAPCTGPPSAPQELWFEVQGSALMLHWRLPQELGGRGDLLFNVVCKECGAGGAGACRRCPDEVHFDPRQRGLTESRVLVGGLRAHVPYILEVQAVNGVSELSPDPPQAAAVNVSTSHAVPSAVPAVHQVSRASNSITVSWPQPDQTNGNILDYQLRYYDQAEDEAHSFTLTSETNTATVTQLSPGHIYGFQVRARTAAGHGPYGGKVYFQTLPQGELSTQLPERLSLVIGSILGALAFLLLAAITVLALIFQRKRRGTGYMEQLQQYSSPGLGGSTTSTPPHTRTPARPSENLHGRSIPRTSGSRRSLGQPTPALPGSFGEVRRGRLQPRGRREQAVAIQALWTGGAESLQMTFLGQAAVLGQFQHPNILRLEGVVTKSRPLMVLTELMELGPLDSFLRQREGQFSSLQLVAMQRGVASAMQYLSSFAFVHRALSAHSVLVNSHLVCKVARLGHRPQGPSCMLRWAAPEVIAHGKHTISSDVWSFGIVMWEVMSYGERPYWDMSDQEVLNAIEQEFRLPPPPGCPPGLHLLMLDTWQKDRTQRPHFDQLVAAFDKMIRKPDTLQAGESPGDRPSQALLNPVALDFPSLESPQAWLSAIGLECYQDNFSKCGLCTFSDVAQLSLEDLPALGITLAGHQKKLLYHIQLLKQHLRPPGSVEV
ncbi:ephrin type-B receptor 6 isoform X1 [Camelus ferus]|uniref:Ephrin type-B receptor 6 n=1 Tax=Camelus ferus TaxID=419612 RepID=A0A8B8TBD2_CAMFR|nr:ephrin type-B receptor 6 isoform X1 [Camelus ferus]XP_032339425.1 ephrin type-B receptor 6 isoform X1 [Camelus ferus]XP_032339426.1 ephrin type-B receptor 6 isoform X1 [Camelus ferus]XP_032339427.1 ephrin type-B receptor 6 isoform X1 [Camelus ferus]